MGLGGIKVARHRTPVPMIHRSLLVLALLSGATAFADDATPDAAPGQIVIRETDQSGVLRGIGRVYLDVSLSEGVRPEDADLRSELRDAVELELRRAGVLLIDGPPAPGSPTLRFSVKFDRGAGRYAARLNLAVRDQVTVTRNRETLVAEIWSVDRSASSAIDTGLSRDIRSRARDMTIEFANALRKANGLR